MIDRTAQWRDLVKGYEFQKHDSDDTSNSFLIESMSVKHDISELEGVLTQMIPIYCGFGRYMIPSVLDQMGIDQSLDFERSIIQIVQSLEYRIHQLVDICNRSKISGLGTIIDWIWYKNYNSTRIVELRSRVEFPVDTREQNEPDAFFRGIIACLSLKYRIISSILTLIKVYRRTHLGSGYQEYLDRIRSVERSNLIEDSTKRIRNELENENQYDVQDTNPLALENASLLTKLVTSDLESIREAHNMVQSISTLQSTIARHIETQYWTVENVLEDAFQSFSHIEKGRESLSRTTKQGDRFYKFTSISLVIMTLCIIFLDL
jgi:hypothetical protein